MAAFAIFTAIAAGIGLLANIGGAISGTAAAAEEQRRRREIADLEAQRAEAEAQRVRQDAAVGADDFRIGGERIHGLQAVAYARSGVRMAGSPMLRLQETRDRIAEGQRRILDRGERSAGYLQHQAQMIRLRGETGLDPGAVAISHLPRIAQSGLNFYDALNNIPAPKVPAAQTPTGGGGTSRLTSFYGVRVDDEIRF